jgi:hypothetical protein
MTAGLEATVAEEFLFSTLTGDATLMAMLPSGANGVANTDSARGAQYPLIVFQFMSGIDAAAVGALRIWTDMLYMVKVIAQGADYSVMDAALARIDALLHRASGTVTDGTVCTCTREQVIRLPDSVAGDPYRQAGAIYRICAQ